MHKHDIPLDTLRTAGQASIQRTDEGALVTLARTLPTERFDRAHLTINAYVSMAQTFRMPLRIDLTAKIDVPGLYILLGEGHVNFGTDWSDNRRLDDPIAPGYKSLYFDNSIPMNRFVTLSLCYGLKSMQVLVDGEVRYATDKAKYMRGTLLAEKNEAGLPLRITCDKGANMVIRALTVTEYDEGEDMGLPPVPGEIIPPKQRNPAISDGEKPTFDGCIALLPDTLRAELAGMDAALRAMRPMRFRRQLEKNGNKITYVASEHGFSYAIYPSGATMHHTLQWYILTNSKPELWHQKADLMEAVLARLDAEDPAFAERMFASLHDCVGCSLRCIVPRAYTFRGKKRVACHGKLRLTMRMDDMRAAMRFIQAVNDMNGGTP